MDAQAFGTGVVMTANDKTGLAGPVRETTAWANLTSKPLNYQPLPAPGTALTAFLRRYGRDLACNREGEFSNVFKKAFLRRYRQELLTAERTRELSTLVECCDVLLMAADGPEVRP